MDLLRMALRLNAVSCLLFGGLFAVHSGSVAHFLGNISSQLVHLVGVALILNGCHLLIAAMRRSIRSSEIYYFSSGDLLWVTLTLGLVASDGVLTTTRGIALSLVIAVLVGALGILQLYALSSSHPRASSPDELPLDLPLAGAIAASWRSMKWWVKAWLFGLNGLFLLALALWPDSIARFTLAAYVASGPWLVAIMIHQRGLTRFLGVAHLVPWIPLGIYLVLRLGSDVAGSRLSLAATPSQWWYAVALLAAMGTCLIADIVDVWRWWRGERYRLGSINAARVGASSLARGTSRQP